MPAFLSTPELCNLNESVLVNATALKNTTAVMTATRCGAPKLLRQELVTCPKSYILRMLNHAALKGF